MGKKEGNLSNLPNISQIGAVTITTEFLSLPNLSPVNAVIQGASALDPFLATGY